MSVQWSKQTLRYFEAHAINPDIAATIGVRERDGKLVYTIKPREGKPFERTRRARLGKERTYQPGRIELALWWPLGIPHAGDPNTEAPCVLINEGESDLLAALSVLASRNGNERARHFLAHSDLTLAAIPGTGYPVDRLACELQAAGTREAYLGFDADESGDDYTARAVEALQAVGIKTMRLPIPEGCDLADELAAAEDPTFRLADLIALAEAEDALSHDSWDSANVDADRDSAVMSHEIDARETWDGAVSHHPISLGTRDGETAFKTRGLDIAAFTDIEHVWTDRIVRGVFNLLAGEEGVGKGCLQAYVIARGTRGKLPGCFEGEPMRVLWIGDEDDINMVVGPRLYLAGADLRCVEEVYNDHDRLLDVYSHADKLEALIKSGPFDLVVFEAIFDNLPSLKNPNDVQAVRASLRPLRAVLRRTNVPALATQHVNKAAGTDFRQKLSQSHQYNALSRSSMLVAHHPFDSDRRVLISGKANYSRLATPLSFSIEGRDTALNDRQIEQPIATEFREEPDLKMEEVLGISAGKREQKQADRRLTLLAALTTEPASAQQLVDRTGIARSSLYRYLEALEEEGLALNTDDGWRRTPEQERDQ